MAGRTLNKLTAVHVARLKEPGRHSDGGGLYLYVDSAEKRRWIFMYARAGKRVELGLGSARDLSLAHARAEAARLREVIALGGDPKAERARHKEFPTFGKCADDYIDAMKPSWRNSKHAHQWVMTLKTYAEPIRAKRVDAITT